MSYDIAVLQVKKTTPRIVANSKTFVTIVKIKKYAIVFNGRTIRNGKVVLKVKGETYTQKQLPKAGQFSRLPRPYALKINII